jgi:hypothetical protein
MAKITRKTQKQFAGSATNVGQFGSLQVGTKVITTDPAVIQGLSAYTGGWSAAVTSGQELPPLEEFNGLNFVNTYQLGYLLQEGVPEYDAGTTYFQNSIVKKPGTYQLYGSKIDNNLGNALTITADWQFLVDLSNPTSNIVWGGTAGGSASVLTLTPTTALSAYAAGNIIYFLPASNNTSGGTTINISGLGAKNITKGGTQALSANDLEAGKLATAVYDGTQFQLLNLPPFAHGSSVAVASTMVLNGTGGDILDLTGTSASIATITLNEGRLKVCKFASAGAVLVYSSNLLLNTNGANYTVAANDVVYFYGLASGVVVGTIFPANGNAPVPTVAPPTFAAISGFIPTNFTGNANNNSVIAISAGQATDSTNAAIISKNTSTSWAVTNGNAINGFQGGTTLPNSSTIHFFICTGGSGTGTFASTSLTPTLPAGYNTYYRRIFSIVTNSSGAVLNGTAIEQAGGGMLFYHITQIQDIAVTTQGTSRVLYTLSVPQNIKVGVKYRATTTTSGCLILLSGDESDVAPSGTATAAPTTAPMNDITSSTGAQTFFGLKGDGELITNTSGQIGCRGSAVSLGLYFTTRGYADFRRA